MDAIAQEEINKILEELKKRGVSKTCPMCGNPHFTIAPAYFVNLLQTSVGNLTLGGKSIPSIPIICTNCGFISQHAIGVLGFMPKESQKEPKK